jgi:hypothetical protein
MTSPVRFPSGLSSAVKGSALWNFGMPDPTKFHVFFDDFDNFEADQWVITRVGATPTEVAANGDGGRLLLTMAATDDSSSSLQWSGDDAAGVIRSFRFQLGKQLWYKSRFQVSDMLQSDFVLGLQIADTTPLAVTDGVYFRKDDGDTNINLVSIAASVASTATKANVLPAANTDFTLAYYFDGVASVTMFVNDLAQGSVNIANLPVGQDLAVSIHMQNGEAVAKSMNLDYVFVAKER